MLKQVRERLIGTIINIDGDIRCPLSREEHYMLEDEIPLSVSLYDAVVQDLEARMLGDNDMSLMHELELHTNVSELLDFKAELTVGFETGTKLVDVLAIVQGLDASNELKANLDQQIDELASSPAVENI